MLVRENLTSKIALQVLLYGEKKHIKHIGSMYPINDKCIEFPEVLKPLAGSLPRLHEGIVLDTNTGQANKREESLYTKLGLLRETILTATSQCQ